MTNQFGIGCDAAAFLLTKHLIQFHNRDHSAADDLLQYSAWSHRWKLVTVAYKDQSGIAWCCLQKLFCQVNIQHGHLVYEDQISIQCLRIAIVTIFVGK